MAKKLYGTDPDQVPTNADLGTIAYQDAERPLLGQTTLKSAGTSLIVERTSDAPNLQLKGNGQNLGQIYAFQNGAGGNMAFYPTNSSGSLSQRMIINRDGNVTINTGNLVMGTSGTGIDFSATGDGSGTMSSELLDDYEEGTWTPALSYGGTSATLTSSTGQYVKIGRLVHVWLMIQVGNLNSGSGSIELSGLPYSSSGNMVYYHGNIQGNAEMNLPTGAGSVMPYVTGGTSTARFLYMTNSTHNDVTSTHFPAPITVYGQMTYSTAT